MSDKLNYFQVVIVLEPASMQSNDTLTSFGPGLSEGLGGSEGSSLADLKKYLKIYYLQFFSDYHCDFRLLMDVNE